MIDYRGTHLNSVAIRSNKPGPPQSKSDQLESLPHSLNERSANGDLLAARNAARYSDV